ncbi:protein DETOXIFICATION 51-like [Apium graveolens]|uniref:protein DETOXIFICATION 51-like n=1 Tax=Apium graveolens TaxID=4045 RepID=UPI003D7BFD0B
MCNQNKSRTISDHYYLNLLCLPPPTKSPIEQDNHFLPSHILSETKSLFKLSFPIAMTALILYARSIISMLFLGHLGDTELAAGSLAMAFANITGYSVLSGLALGMEPLCTQAFGAQRPKLLSLTLQRTILFLLVFSIPITFLWLNISHVLILLHQQPNITALARTYLIFAIPDLLTNSFIHPIRIYLRAQGITHPLTLASLAGTILHLPINILLVSHFKLGVAGVAAASAASNLLVVVTVVCYVWATDIHVATWSAPTRECLTGWMPLIRLAAPSCVSVCLEWWWYEIMIVLCGLLVDPRSTVASMGVLIQTTSFIYVFPSSLSFAVSTRVGNELGANHPDRARVSALVSILLGGLMGLCAMCFAIAVKDVWAHMFTSDANILKLTSTVLPILGLCELGNCPQTIGCGVVRGTARPSTAANVNLGAFYLVGMPVAIGLGFWLELGFSGLWLGMLAAQFCCAGLMLCAVVSTKWDEQARKAQALTRLPAGGDKEPLICITVT